MAIFLGSSVFGALELRQCADAPAACPFRQPQPDSATPTLGTRMRCLAIDRAATAADWLRAAVTHAGDMAALRQLVAGETRSVGLANHQVIDLVAQRIARRDLCLLVSNLLASGTQVQPREAPRPAASGVTPSSLRSGGESPVPAAPVPSIAEFADDVNQALQAAALEQAARLGKPFCEVCEQARQRAAAGSGSAG
jgi:hypothetical protein